MNLCEAVSMFSRSGLIGTLGPFDLVAVQANGITYYCFFVEETQTMLAYPKEAGYASFLKSFSDTRDEGTPLKEFNRKIEQDVLIVCPGEKEPVLEKRPLEDVHVPQDPSLAEHLLEVLLKSGDFFVRWQDKETWMKGTGIAAMPEDIAPLVHEDGSVTPLFVKDIPVTFDHAVATISDEARIVALKRKKQENVIVLNAMIFVCPVPLGHTYPFVQILFDKTRHKPIDAVMIEDFSKGHVTFVEHFLSICGQEGIPAAMHCMDERSFYLYREISRSLDMMITLEDKTDEEMDSVCEGYVRALASVIRQGMEEADRHEHDGSCDHER